MGPFVFAAEVLKWFVTILFSGGAGTLIGLPFGMFKGVMFILRWFYGPVTSAAGKLSPRDVAHILVMILGYFATALSFSSWLFGDVSSALAYLAAGVAGLVTWLHKLSSKATEITPPAATPAN